MPRVRRGPKGPKGSPKGQPKAKGKGPGKSHESYMANKGTGGYYSGGKGY